MGLPSVAMSVLGLALPPVQAAALIVIPSLFTNLWQAAMGPALGAVVRRFGVLIVTGMLGVFLGIGVLTSGAGKAAGGVLGVVLMLYGAVGLTRARFSVPVQAEWWASPLVGLATGIVTGATGLYVIPAVPYFAALRIGREELVQLMGFAFSTSSIALAIGLGAAGELGVHVAVSSVAGLGAAFVGMLLGQRLRGRLPTETFRRWYFVGMVAIGGYLLARALRG